MEDQAGSTPAVRGDGAGARRVIVVAAAAVGEDVVGRLREALDGSPAELFVVAPALTESAFEHAMGSVDDAIVEARERLDESIETLRSSALEVEGVVGDSDPLLAIEDALRLRRAEKIVVVTNAGDPHWLEEDLFSRARQRFEPPLVHLAIETDGVEQRVTDVESAGHGAEPPPDIEVETQSGNMPRFSARDLLGIAVAVIGSLAAILIAAGCSDGQELQRTTPEAGQGSDGSCVAAYVVAGVSALVNVAHVVGLVLFESTGYRGGWSRFFAWLSLVGTPLAIVATIALAH